MKNGVQVATMDDYIGFVKKERCLLQKQRI